MPEPRRIALITSSYPDLHAPEGVFIAPEVRALAAAGMRLTIYPIRVPKLPTLDLPSGVNLDLTLAWEYRFPRVLRHGLRALVRKTFWKEFPRILNGKHRLNAFRRFLQESLRAEASRSLQCTWGGFDWVYTYWCMGETLGLIRCGLPTLSRVHGNDIYAESSKNGGYLPYLSEAQRGVSRLIVLSSQARHYALEHHRVDPRRIHVSPLGVPSQLNLAPIPDPTGPIRLLSIAYPWPLKRLPLIGAFANCLKHALPKEKKILWTHIGSFRDSLGPDLGADIVVEALGPQSHAFILDYLQTIPVHFLINLSESEGTPVTLMEGMSLGIPVIAPAIGGIPELLAEGGGHLVPKEPDLGAIAEEVAALIQDPECMQRLRAEALQAQKSRFDQVTNHQALAQWLAGLIPERVSPPQAGDP